MLRPSHFPFGETYGKQWIFTAEEVGTLWLEGRDIFMVQFELPWQLTRSNMQEARRLASLKFNDGT
jgi:hypothetical protein